MTASGGNRRRGGRRLVAVALLAPKSAAAHLVSTGFGPFYDGLAHPFLSPTDLLPVLALGIWAGLRGPAKARWIVLCLPVAWLVGSLGGAAVPASRVLTGGELAIGLLVAAAAAANLSASRTALLAAAAALGVVHGIAATAGEAASLAAAGGAAISVAACFAVVAGQVASLRHDWMRIAGRVLSSWAVAIGMLQLGWLWRGL